MIHKKSLYYQVFAVWFYERAFSATSENFGKFEEHQVGTNQHQFLTVTVFLGNLSNFSLVTQKLSEFVKPFYNWRESN